MAGSPERPSTGSVDGTGREVSTPVKSQLSSKATAFSIAAIIGQPDKGRRASRSASESGDEGEFCQVA